MNMMSDVELLLILGFYYVGKEKNADEFTALFNCYFGKDLSVQTILHEVSRFRNVDPVNNVSGLSGSSRYMKIWNEYIGKDKVTELRELYKSFKNGEFLTSPGKSSERQKLKNDIIQNYIVKDEPKELKKTTDKISESFTRDRSVVEHALFAAKYLCEGDCGSELFTRKDGKTSYTEAHHLIPLEFQQYFDYSLDVEANVVSLCPRCHRLLHYGLDNEVLLKVLYEKRIERLIRCKISISYEKLMLLYAGMCIDEDV